MSVAKANQLITVVGPTGAGKSNLAIQIALDLIARGGKAEIINADSMQFYRGMNIGTAKLPIEERQGVKHHLFDWLEITDESTAAEYQAVTRPLIESLQMQGITPILVGGSMLYVAAVLNLFEFPARDEALRVIANLVTPELRPEPEANVAIGKRVRVVFQDLAPDFALPQFTLTDEPPEGRVWRFPG